MKVLLKNPGVLIVLLLPLICLIYAESRQNALTVKDIEVKIDLSEDNFFINQEDVRTLLNLNGEDRLVDKKAANVDFKQLEKRVLNHKFVRTVEVYRDLDGILHAHIGQRRPVARVLVPKASDVYIGSEGNVLPLSRRFTARVMLLEGEGVDSIRYLERVQGTTYDSLFKFIEKIDADPFWKAQIAEMNYSKEGYLVIRPQVTKQIIEFGKPKNVEVKLKKLEIFYDRVLKAKGWNTYERVNVMYRDQIICE